jgi:phosphate-selective porin
MKTRVACIIAGAVLAMTISSTAAAAAAADDREPRVVAEAQPPHTAAPSKEQPAPHVPGAQQMKMKNCNEEAKKKELRGDERRAFMSSCLKG